MNGVNIFPEFFNIFPGKFKIITNGVNHRRWLLKINPLLAGLVSEKIGEGWINEPERLRELNAWSKDEETLMRLRDIRRENKKALAWYIKQHNGIDADIESIFDAQVKRLHEYKRQLLNVLRILYLYNRLKVVFLENYGVTLAERIIPTADMDEQISTASKEASGMGNMKFMMNGSLTIGTFDGANLEIRDAGPDNIYICLE